MNLLQLFRVETLDARFVSKSSHPLPGTQASKWKTGEYYAYALAFATIPFFMFKSVYDVSQPSHPSYKQYGHLLEDGWVPGRKVDNSDAQYRSFRDNIPYMGMVLVAHPLLRRVYDKFFSSEPEKAGNGDARLNRRITYDLLFAAIFSIALHGVSALKVLLILWVNYQIATRLSKSSVGPATWTFNIAILFANELCHGYQFADVFSLILPTQTTLAGQQTGEGWGEWLDSHGGLIPRWEILFNITVLRLIAFNFDYLWSLDRRASSPIEKKNLDLANLSERDRVNIGAHISDFTFRNYLAYVLYSPLYLAGPIVNFNDYISQCRYPLATTSRQ
ncbi:glycerol:H+ symporter-like protein, partial [Hortaea werneckii]